MASDALAAAVMRYIRTRLAHLDDPDDREAWQEYALAWAALINEVNRGE